MEAIADKVIGLLGSLAYKELELICNLQDDVESMKSTVSAIKAVLLDAERKAIKSHQINDWLQKLKDVLLDAEDLLDAYSADELAREVMTKGKMGKEVRIFFSKSNRIVCAAKLGREIKALKKKLDGISNNMKNLHLSEISSIESNYEWRQTQSFVRGEDVIGRDNERMQLVGILLNPPDDVVKNNNVSVVAIVGIGGLGKTTLAQQVYNDEAIKRHFELMKWVCVADESTDNKFNFKRVAQKIIGQEYSEKEQVAQGLRDTIEGKIFLLVLDDVWNEDREKWLELESLLKGGRKGSVIIMTTRHDKVAEIMNTHLDLRIPLQGLKDKKPWELFCRVAFREGKEPDNQELVGIGRDIVDKCAGVPLAIRTIGSLLYRKKLGVSEWSYFRDNELATIDSEVDKIFSILKLSYDHLPSHLKNCFAFCSLFPKDYEMNREKLIQLWMAEGFIQPSDKNRRLEDIGDGYFMQLLSRCLFQDVKQDAMGDIGTCKMHDLIHDLAQSISKTECCLVTSEKIEEGNIGDGIRHVSIHVDGGWKFEVDTVNTRKVRTILSPKGRVDFILRSIVSRYALPICATMKNLRVLDLCGNEFEIIPESIGDLKHLRYLDLRVKATLTKLPRGITRLHNLLTLKLNGCIGIRGLPRDVKRLVRLRYLELNGCYALASLPESIGNLTSLQSLDLSYCSALASLPESIGNLTSLQSLYLFHCSALASLPESIGNLTSLQMLGLYFCSALASLPESIGNLTSLQMLRLYYCSALASLPESIGNLSSLQRLTLNRCSALASVPESIGNLSSLQELTLDRCSALASLPNSIKSLTSLQCLKVDECPALMERYGPQLQGFNWPALAHIPRVMLL